MEMEMVQTQNIHSLEGSAVLARLENGARITAALNPFIRSLLRAHRCTNTFCNTFYAVKTSHIPRIMF